MAEHLLLELSLVIVLGIFAQWLGWRLRVPSILLLLSIGLVLGPVSGLVTPRQLLGPLLYPVVSLATAVILFEGGLSLSIQEMRAIGRLATRLVIVGAAVSFSLIALAGHWVLGFEVERAVLLAAILIVTGPTVIVPMLHHVRPSGPVGTLLKWEGIVIDPLGAMAAVLVLHAIVQPAGEAYPVLAYTLARWFAAGIGVGGAAATLMVVFMRRQWIPDYLQSPVALMLVIASFTGANLLEAESGLLAVTVMGFLLANQRKVSIRHIVEFKENLRIMLIATVFILLSANLDAGQLRSVSWRAIPFVLALIIVIRPAAVFAATLGTSLTRQERMFLAALAPRGIVAAAVSSVFALRLADAGIGGGDELATVTFVVIIATIVVYGLGAGRIAARLGLVKDESRGVVLLGGGDWTVHIARALMDAGISTLVVNSDRRDVLALRREGVPAAYVSIIAEHLLDQIDLGDKGYFLGLAANDESNSLAALHYSHEFGRSRVFQLAVDDEAGSTDERAHLRGRTAFASDTTHRRLSECFAAGWVVKRTRLGNEFDFEAYRGHYGAEALPLFIIDERGGLHIVAANDSFAPQVGQVLISLVPPRTDEGAGPRDVTST